MVAGFLRISRKDMTAMSFKARLLLVDDDPDVLDMLRQLLAHEEYEVICAVNGMDALEKATEASPDIILSDVIMPEMNGFDLCRQLRANPLLAEVPIILLTGLANSEYYVEGLRAGADDFISKPFDRIKLSARVAALARLNRYRRLLEERARFDRLIELSPDGILLVGPDGAMQMANRAALRMLRLDRGEEDVLVGKNITQFVMKRNVDDFMSFLCRAVAEPEANQRQETCLVRSDATRFPAEIAAGYCAWQSQPAVQLVVRDITERKAAEEEIRRAHEQVTLACDTSLEGWSRALELRDHNTVGHAQRVAGITLRLARALAVPEEELIHIRRGALLHDIGKMGIPDMILNKPGPLTDGEWDVMRRHPVYAFEMLSPIAFLRPALDIPCYHHERWDGTGYPHGLKGREIPLAARIFAVVDVWDALCSNRPYSHSWSCEVVRNHLQELAGTHLDPEVVSEFLKLEATLTGYEEPAERDE
jgi:PAS domain S-box-containing protein/putative nucleotidyltransferase with HDIG domain